MRKPLLKAHKIILPKEEPANKIHRLKQKFYIQPTCQVAQNMLGKILVRKFQGQRLAGKIIETEAYLGPKDKASHVTGGQTKRNRIVFEGSGLIYIYLCYGIHWQLNITTGPQEKPECVLIRSLEPIEGIKVMAANRSLSLKKTNGSYSTANIADGPGKLCQALNLDKQFYGEDLTKSNRIWIEKGPHIAKEKIKKTPRIGVDYAENWADKKLRYIID